jgi:hypothetical protein
MQVAGLSKTPLNVYQIDITAQKIREVISIDYFSSPLFPLKVRIIKRFSTPHNLLVFLKVLSDVDALSVSNV